MTGRAAAAQTGALDVFAQTGHALSHPARLRLLALLGQAPKTVSALAHTCHESVANTSAHLAVLAAAGMVTRTREGRHVRYALADAQVSRLVAALRETAETVAPAPAQARLATFHGGDVAPVEPGTLRDRLRAGVALIDVRPPDEFAAGHLPGARSIPFATLRRERASRTDETPALVYCRGRYCMDAVESVRWLSRSGRRVQRLPFGVAEWTAQGYPLEA